MKKILQLCCWNNHWSNDCEVESWDLKLRKDIFDIPDGYPGKFDIVVAAPPCDQFTKANALRWRDPGHFLKIAERCFELCKQTGSVWILENPPGRIEKFIPELSKYRLCTWQSYTSNKEYVLYGNTILMLDGVKRFGKIAEKRFDNMSKTQRESWEKMLIPSIKRSLWHSEKDLKKEDSGVKAPVGEL